MCKIGIDENLHFFVGLDIAGLDFARALGVDGDDFGHIGEQFNREQLNVEDQLCHVFLDARHGGELMLHALDANAGSRNSRQGIEQHATQGIAQSLPEATLQRIDDKLRVAIVFARLHTFYLRLFDLID